MMLRELMSFDGKLFHLSELSGLYFRTSDTATRAVRGALDSPHARLFIVS